jgi:hypothetical protein
MKPGTKNKLEIRTAFLAISGIVAILIAAYQILQLVPIFSANFWSFLIFIPLIVGLLLMIFALQNHQQKKVALQALNWLSKNRKLASIVLLFLMIIFVFVISRTADMNDELINLGMSGLGLLFYGLLLVFLIFSNFIFIRERKNDRFLIGVLLLIALAWIFMLVTRIGLQPDTAFWNVAGVPMMWVSLVGIIVMVFLFDQAGSWLRAKTNWKIDPKTQVLLEILLVLAIWLASALIWIKTPYSNSHFLLGPLPPDGHYWPNSDAKLMDLGGQYLIIGGKLETPYFTEKPFYALFLGLLHFFFGQTYQVVTNIQIILLALIPVLLYYFGKQLSGRLFGIALAAFAIIKEATAILFTYKISVSNSRLMMTELPSALLLIMAAILLFHWLRKPEQARIPALLAGAVLGIASYVRSNNLIVLLALLMFIALTSGKEIKKRLPQIGFFVLGAFITILPWTVYTQVTYGKDPLTWKIEAALSTRFDLFGSDENEAPILSATPPPTPTSLPTDSHDDNSLDVPPFADFETGETGTEPAGFYRSKLAMTVGHFLNNQVKALFVLPIQVYPARPTTILEQDYWHEPVEWSGKMPAEHVVAFIVNLIFISLGIHFSWKTFGWAGLIPLVIEMAYYLSNALVRTSGSRYLVAVDWVVYLYFLLGIWHVLRSLRLLSPITFEQKTRTGSVFKGFWISLAICLAVGLSLPIMNLAFPSLYHNESNADVYDGLPMEKIESEIGITPAEMQAFYDQPNTVFLFGREIYPAYLTKEGIPGEKALFFTLLTPGRYDVAIPYGVELTENLPAGEDMIVIGCKQPGEQLVLAYLGYFIQSDQLIWSTSTTFADICR